MAEAINILSSEEVCDRLGLDITREKVASALDSALKSVNPRFEAVLQCSLSETPKADVFFVDSDLVYPIAGLYRLRLSSGFIRDGSLSIGSATDLASLQSSATAVVVPSTVNLEKGFIYLPASDCADLHVQVSYVAGFSGEDDPSIPVWLKEAALHYVVKMLALNQSSEMKQELKNVLDMVDRVSADIVDAHLRTLPMAVHPLY